MFQPSVTHGRHRNSSSMSKARKSFLYDQSLLFAPQEIRIPRHILNFLPLKPAPTLPPKPSSSTIFVSAIHRERQQMKKTHRQCIRGFSVNLRGEVQNQTRSSVLGSLDKQEEVSWQALRTVQLGIMCGGVQVPGANLDVLQLRFWRVDWERSDWVFLTCSTLPGGKFTFCIMAAMRRLSAFFLSFFLFSFHRSVSLPRHPKVSQMSSQPGRDALIPEVLSAAKQPGCN